jgi:glycine cleavage system H protein
VRYTKTHEWVEPENGGIITVGVSDRAQQVLGEIAFVELPEEGEEFEQDDPLGSVESADGKLMNIHSPVTGEVIEVNVVLESSPDLVNRSPEGDGWLVKMRMEFPKELGSLMTPEEYEEYEEDIIEEEDEFEDEEEEDF